MALILRKISWREYDRVEKEWFYKYSTPKMYWLKKLLFPCRV